MTLDAERRLDQIELMAGHAPADIMTMVRALRDIIEITEEWREGFMAAGGDFTQADFALEREAQRIQDTIRGRLLGDL